MEIIKNTILSIVNEIKELEEIQLKNKVGDTVKTFQISILNLKD